MPTGRLVVVTIRRPGDSAHDRIGRPDLSTDEAFIETGISRAHGFMAEEVVADARYLVPVPDELEDVAILTEPLSCITKSLRQADQVQARLELWEPRRALVTGAGTIGLLATLALRLRGLDVTTYSRRPAPVPQQPTRRAHRGPLRQRGRPRPARRWSSATGPSTSSSRAPVRPSCSSRPWPRSRPTACWRSSA